MLKRQQDGGSMGEPAQVEAVIAMLTAVHPEQPTSSWDSARSDGRWFAEHRPAAGAVRAVGTESLQPERDQRVRQFGNCFLGRELWKRLGLDRFFEALLDAEPAEVPWSRVAALLAINRLCVPSSELGIEERWYPATALDDLLGFPTGTLNDTRLYRCLDRLLPHKTKLEQHLKQRYGEL